MSASVEQTEDRLSQLGRWLSLGGSIIAPATLITALLFYFGYVSSRAQYDYFGVDVDTVGLSTQDYVMRSPQPLLVPLLALTLLAGGFLAAHLAARRRAAVHPSFRSVAKGLVAVGLILLGLGVALLFGYAVIGDWAYYPLLTSLILAAGGTLAVYGITTIRWMDKRAERTSVGSAFAGEGDRKATRAVADVNTVVEIVTASLAINTSKLTEAVREKIPSRNQGLA